MTADHTIRLGDPWQVEPTESGGSRFCRRFGWTAQLDRHEKLFFVVGEANAAGRVWLNGVSLGTFGLDTLPARFEISSLVKPRNEAVIEVAGGRVAAVRLEVQETSIRPPGDTS
jgi:hypothetical protein